MSLQISNTDLPVGLRKVPVGTELVGGTDEECYWDCSDMKLITKSQKG
ncbi:MAG: hypothetical protein WA421_02895 [Nitrososphaeraceae archaeon]